MPDSGPCHACPRATGVLTAPTGLSHTCPPEEWRVCNVLYRWSKAGTAPGPKPRSRSYRRGWPLPRKARIAVRLFRRSWGAIGTLPQMGE